MKRIEEEEEEGTGRQQKLRLLSGLRIWPLVGLSARERGEGFPDVRVYIAAAVAQQRRLDRSNGFGRQSSASQSSKWKKKERKNEIHDSLPREEGRPAYRMKNGSTVNPSAPFTSLASVGRTHAGRLSIIYFILAQERYCSFPKCLSSPLHLVGGSSVLSIRSTCRVGAAAGGSNSSAAAV